MTTKILSLLITITLAGNAYANKEAGNGGGGVKHDGRYMTFYSAGLYTEPAEQSPIDVPQLDALVSYVNGLTYLTDSSKVTLASTIVPSPTHQYFAIKADKFDAETKARLLAEFSRVTGVPTDGLELFAVTDTHARQTFLLPTFYQLSAHDQMAILFHESYWLLHPDATYSEVVAAEMAFQAALEAPKDAKRVLQFISHVGTVNDELIFSVQSDIATGALKGLVNDKKQVSIPKLFGQKYLATRGDARYVTVYLAGLVSQYPKSAFLPLLQNHEVKYVGQGNSLGSPDSPFDCSNPTVTLSAIQDDITSDVAHLVITCLDIRVAPDQQATIFMYFK